MTKTTPIAILLTTLLISCTGAAATGAEPERLPAPKAAAEGTSKIKAWLDGLKEKTPEEIAALLGKGGERETWEFRGRQEPKITFHFDDDTTLMLFFFEGKVIRAGFLVNE